MVSLLGRKSETEKDGCKCSLTSVTRNSFIPRNSSRERKPWRRQIARDVPEYAGIERVLSFVGLILLRTGLMKMGFLGGKPFLFHDWFGPCRIYKIRLFYFSYARYSVSIVKSAFQISRHFKPAGDQPKAIYALIKGLG